MSFALHWKENQLRQLYNTPDDVPLTHKTSLYACQDETAPHMFNTQFSSVCTLTTNLKAISRICFELRVNQNGMRCIELDFEIVMKIDSASFDFQLSVNNHIYGSVAALCVD